MNEFEGKVPVPVWRLFDNANMCWLRETAGGAGRVSHERAWVPATDEEPFGTEYWSEEGANWAAARAGSHVRVYAMSMWVDSD